MTMFLVIGYILLIVMLVGLATVTIAPVQYSLFELERRQKLGDENARAIADKHSAYTDLISLQRVAISLGLVVAVVASISLLGWIVGLAASVLIALQYGTLARVAPVHQLFQKQYERYEPALIRLIQRYPKVMLVMRTITVPPKEDRIDSREELLHYVAQAGMVLTHDEKQLITHGLSFKDQTVQSVMTPRSVIDSIKKGELLGPLVLDDLHKTGHSRFPVIDGDIDHVIGMLYVHNLLTLDTTRKHTAKVETAMDPRVFYIRHDQTLDHALTAFIRTHHHLFVVVNEYRETVGLLSLEDVVETLLGKKIVDEFDTHDDLRAVAARNPRGNNKPQIARNV